MTLVLTGRGEETKGFSTQFGVKGRNGVKQLTHWLPTIRKGK